MHLYYEVFIGLSFDGLYAVLPSLAASLNCFLNYAWWETKHSHRGMRLLAECDYESELLLCVLSRVLFYLLGKGAASGWLINKNTRRPVD